MFTLLVIKSVTSFKVVNGELKFISSHKDVENYTSHSQSRCIVYLVGTSILYNNQL